jgi:putative Mg2+ transporter-C (MgtC) family protein
MGSLPVLDLFGRLGLSVLLCGLIGLERETRDQAAGLRTHVLVGAGSTLFTLLSAYGFVAGSGRIDPTRISAQIVTGIGFLGAGAILRNGMTVRGLTTAAGLWIVAAIGMAAGAGAYLAASVSTAVVLITLIGFRHLRPTLMQRLRSDYVLLELAVKDQKTFGKAVAILARSGVSVERVDSEHSDDDHYRYSLELRHPASTSLAPVLEELHGLSGAAEVSASGSHLNDEE